MSGKENSNDKAHGNHITSYATHFGTWLGLIILTVMTVTVSVYGADIYMTSILTALIIATTKALVVAYWFMHLKYDPKIYQYMIGIVMLLFVVFVVLTLFDYLARA